ncbi:MAG: GSCFA domain-containing protein [Raineya sp.]
MSFRTEIILPNYHLDIDYQDYIFCIGSCFAEVMAERLAQRKFRVANPFGTLFNPASIFRLLRIAAQTEKIDETLFLKNQEQIAYHYDFHSSWKNFEIDALQCSIKEKMPAITEFLNSSQYLFITFGTAWVYELKPERRIVANCHKMPALLFNKRLLSVEEILQDFKSLENYLSSKKIILTLSPVRHLKDTLPLNAVSKSVLRLACHYLQEHYPNIYYFPAFELINDDLRDYRFYADDLLHISSQGEAYVWDKFVHSCLSAKSQELMKKWEKIAARLKHQFFNTQTPAYQDFLQKTLSDLKKISTEIDVSVEIAELEKLLLTES